MNSPTPEGMALVDLALAYAQKQLAITDDNIVMLTLAHEVASLREKVGKLRKALEHTESRWRDTAELIKKENTEYNYAGWCIACADRCYAALAQTQPVEKK